MTVHPTEENVYLAALAGLLLRREFEVRREMKGASLSGLALCPDSSSHQPNKLF